MQAERWIDAPPASVFARIADPRDEADLRRENVRIAADGPLRLGTTYVETIDLGFVNDYRMEVAVTELERGLRVRLEAPPNWRRAFAVDRIFLPQAGGTRLIYVIDFEDRVVHDIARLPVPLWLAQWVYGAEMRSYLRRLAEAVSR